MGASSPTHTVATLPPEAPAPTPADLLRAVERLGTALDAKLDDHATKVDARFQAIESMLDAQKSAVTRANDNATTALRSVSELKKETDDTRQAMVTHAATVADASRAIVESNASQTPMIENTEAMMATMKRYTPVALAAAVALGTTLGAFWHALTSALGK